MSKINIIFLFIVYVFFASCDSTVKYICGEPEGKEKAFIDSLNFVYQEQLTFEQVPCYPGYLQATLHKDISSVNLDSVEVVIKKNKYVEFLVYDEKGSLIRGDRGSM